MVLLLVLALLGVVAAQYRILDDSETCSIPQLLGLYTAKMEQLAATNWCQVGDDAKSCICTQSIYDVTNKEAQWSIACYNNTKTIQFYQQRQAQFAELCSSNKTLKNNTFALPTATYNQGSSCNSSVARYEDAVQTVLSCQPTTGPGYYVEPVARCICDNAQKAVSSLSDVNAACGDTVSDAHARNLYDAFSLANCTGLTLAGVSSAMQAGNVATATPSRSTTVSSSSSSSSSSSAAAAATTTAAARSAAAATTSAAARSAARENVSGPGGLLLGLLIALATIVTVFVL